MHIGAIYPTYSAGRCSRGSGEPLPEVSRGLKFPAALSSRANPPNTIHALSFRMAKFLRPLAYLVNVHLAPATWSGFLMPKNTRDRDEAACETPYKNP